MKQTLLLLISVLFTFSVMNAQNATLAVTSHDPVPDPLAFCLGESVTVELTNLNTDLYESLGGWYRCSEVPDFDGWSNYDKWEYIDNWELTYTFEVNADIYLWANVSDLNFGYATPLLHISTAGTVPTLVYTEADTAFCDGSTVTLSVDPSDLGADNYMWFKDDVEIANEVSSSLIFSEPGVYHVSAKDAAGACPDNFIPSEKVNFALISPNLYGDFKADLNRVVLSTDATYASYQWYSGADESSLVAISGQTTEIYNATITSTDTYYAVEVVTTGGCTAMSEATLINSAMYGIPVIKTPTSTFTCRDGSILLEVDGDFATYQWYKNGNSIYGKTGSSISVDGGWSFGSGSYSVKVTTLLDAEDILESDAIDIEVAKQPTITVKDFATMCLDGDITLYTNDNYDTYQWYVNDVNNFSTAMSITDETDTALVVTVLDEGRYYWVETSYNECTDVSYNKGVFAFTLYAPSVYTAAWLNEGNFCLGDSIQLQGGGWNVTWQWYKDGKMLDGITEQKPYVKDYGFYKVGVTSIDCPDMEIVMSTDSVEITSTVLPNILIKPEGELYNNIPNHYIFCERVEIEMNVENANNYSAYQWIGKLYAPSSTTDDWEDLEGETTDSYGFVNGTNAKLRFKVRVDSLMTDGSYCVGESDYVVIDAWAFSSPAVVTDVVFPELCEEGDSVLLYLAYPGEWERFEWYNGPDLIAGETNDSIYAKEIGMHTIMAYPTKCPDIGYNSGMGPNVAFMPNAEIWENDTLIWAMPISGGEYTYQWYHNDEPINMDTLDYPTYILKNQLKKGNYTVEVLNITECSRMSDAYLWIPVGTEDIISEEIQMYPNPIKDVLNIQIPDISKVNAIEIYNVAGVLVERINSFEQSMRISMQDIESGVYILRVQYANNKTTAYRIVKN